MNFDLIRTLVRKAEAESPFNVGPQVPFLSITHEPTLSMSMAIPKGVGEEFEHWRFLVDLEFIRVSHEGRPGFGKMDTKVEGLTAKGKEFVELSRSDELWARVRKRCTRAGVSTLPLLVGELRIEARKRLAAARKGEVK